MNNTKRQQFVEKLEALAKALRETAVAAKAAKEETTMQMPSGLAAMEFYEGFYSRNAQKRTPVLDLLDPASGLDHLIMRANVMLEMTSK